MRMLVTGGSGFIGACLVHRLVAEGQDVHLFLRKGSNTWRINDVVGKYTVHSVDLLDRNQVGAAVSEIRPDAVFHLATYGAYATQKDPEATVKTNVTGGINLLDSCISTGFAKFVNVSSSSEYGVKEIPMREDALLEPNSLYGITKAAFTHYCNYRARHGNLPVTTFRIFAAYGYYEDPMRLFPSLIVPCLRGESPKLSSPDSVRDFIFVEDILDAFQKSVGNRKSDGQVLNLGTGTQHTVREAAETVAKLTGFGRPIEWGAMEKKQFEPRTWVADMEKTASVLGWKPQYSLEAGTERAINWFRANMRFYSQEVR